MGKLHYLENFKYSCEEFDENEIKLARTDDISPFMIAYRGECSFV